jgi:sec-independent protein translocase protein TatC
MGKLLRLLWRLITAPFRFILWIIHLIIRWFRTISQEISEFIKEEPEDAPLPDAFAKAVQNPEGIFYHVNELRKHLFRAAIFMVVTTAFSFIFTSQIIDLLARPIGGIGALRAIEVTESIGVFMRVALLAGFALALPYIAFELWLFIAPGLKPRSRVYGLIALPSTAILFILGMAFAYRIMLPTALPFLLHFMGITTIPRPSNYVTFVTGLMFWIGVAFEFPLVVFVLAEVGLVKAKQLKDQWRLAIVIIAVISAVVTPTVDPINMSLVMAPMTILYFLSVGLAYFAQRRRAS